MPAVREISGKDNPIFRLVKSLHDHRTAAKEGLLFLEGIRLCEDVLSFGHTPVYILCSNNAKELAQTWSERFRVPEDTVIVSMPPFLFEKLSSTNHPQGIAIVIRMPSYPTVLPSQGRDIYLLCENTSDPGNLGTMIRTADAFGFSAVLITSGTVDPYNEKVIRASMGSCFHIPIMRFETIRDACLQLHEFGVELIASHLNGEPLPGVSFRYPAAVVVGNEAHGLSDECTAMCDRKIAIPMPGHAESLNASIAFSVFGYVLMTGK